MTSQDVVTLRDYIDSRLDAIELARAAALHSMEKRLDGMNEFRATLTDQSAKFAEKEFVSELRDRTELELKTLRSLAACHLTIVEHEAFRARIDKEIASLREFRAVIDSKASNSALLVSTGIAIVGLLISIISVVFHAVR